jgi:hypothetical protein
MYRMRAGVILGISLMGFLTACESGPQETTLDAGIGGVPLEDTVGDPPAEKPPQQAGAKACPADRPGFMSWFTVSNGLYGDWAGCWSWCPSGKFVYRYQEMVEDTGHDDDTAENAIALGCYDRNTGAFDSWITSSTGWWGSWYMSGISASTESPAIGATVFQQPSQGSGDDLTMLRLNLWMKNGAITQAPNPLFDFTGGGPTTGIHNYNESAQCPTGQAICGIKTRLESKQGTHADDTALNGVRIACCKF